MDTLEKETSVRNLNTTYRLFIPMLLPDSPYLFVGSILVDLTWMNRLIIKVKTLSNDSTERYAGDGSWNGAGIFKYSILGNLKLSEFDWSHYEVESRQSKY